MHYKDLLIYFATSPTIRPMVLENKWLPVANLQCERLLIQEFCFCQCVEAHTCRLNPNALVWVQLRDIGSFILSIWADGIITHVNSLCSFPPIQQPSINLSALTQTLRMYWWQWNTMIYTAVQASVRAQGCCPRLFVHVWDGDTKTAEFPLFKHDLTELERHVPSQSLKWYPLSTDGD